jgi:hypothetical protein
MESKVSRSCEPCCLLAAVAEATVSVRRKVLGSDLIDAVVTICRTGLSHQKCGELEKAMLSSTKLYW